jgi:predicted metal-dependent phosphoesterase TrpH
MRIDLYVHTLERSSCAQASEDAQILAAIDQGLDGLAITDHERLVSQAHIAMLNRKYAPFRVFGGVEISLQEGEHALVLGVHIPVLERTMWTYPELHALVRERGGWLAIAHPFRFGPSISVDIERYPPDALEGCSINVPLHQADHIREIAADLGIQVICNSDAHHTRHIGAGYNLLEREILRPPAQRPQDDMGEHLLDERALVECLKAGDFLCVCPIA